MSSGSADGDVDVDAGGGARGKALAGAGRPAADALPTPPSPHNEVLLRHDGVPREYVHDLPQIRAFIESLPETAATFSLGDERLSLATSPDAVPVAAMELLGAWPAPDMVARSRQKPRLYVNPGYAHARVLSDVVVQCECGARMNVSYDDERFTNLDDEHEHTSACKKYHRLEARARLLREREQMLVRCITRFGWLTSRIAPRLGLEHYSSFGNALGVQCTDLREEFFERSGNTYAYLSTHTGLSPETVQAIYGRSASAMRKRIRRYTAYEYDPDQGAWVQDP